MSEPADKQIVSLLKIGVPIAKSHVRFDSEAERWFLPVKSGSDKNVSPANCTLKRMTAHFRTGKDTRDVPRAACEANIVALR